MLVGLEREEKEGANGYPASAWRLYASKEMPGASLTRMNVKPLGVRQSAELEGWVSEGILTDGLRSGDGLGVTASVPLDSFERCELVVAQ